MACRIGKVFNEHGARKGGVIRIDSAEFGVEKWKENPERYGPYRRYFQKSGSNCCGSWRALGCGG